MQSLVGEGFDGVEVWGGERGGGAFHDDDGLGEADLAGEMGGEGGKGAARGGGIREQGRDLSGLGIGGWGQEYQRGGEESPEEENEPAKFIGERTDGNSMRKRWEIRLNENTAAEQRIGGRGGRPPSIRGGVGGLP